MNKLVDLSYFQSHAYSNDKRVTIRYKAQNKDYKAIDHGQAAFIGYHPASTSIEIPEHFLSRSKTFQFPCGKTAIW